MKRVVRVAKNLVLPLDCVTETFGIVAVKGVGKTTTAAVMAEQMLKVGAQVVILDPTGAWWGLRSSADGRHDGLPVVIFGGDHADVPLDPSSGKLVADLIVDKRISVVIDLSSLRKADQNRFVTTFAEQLYHRNRKAMHLIVDEADAYIPQRPQHGEERMLGAFEDIVRRGRIKGIGITMITQRSAVINKNVLSQISTLIVMRTFAPQDRKAVEFWIEVHGDEAGRKQVMESLASLKIGEAWFWSPGWMNGLLKRVQVNQRETFNSSATPKMGVRVREPKRLAPVDLARIKDQIKDTIEKAKQEDPRELRAQILELQRQMHLRPVVTQAMKERVVEKKVPWLSKADAVLFKKIVTGMRMIDEKKRQFMIMMSTFEVQVLPHFEIAVKDMRDLSDRLEAAGKQVGQKPIPYPLLPPPSQIVKQLKKAATGPQVYREPLSGSRLPSPSPRTIKEFRQAGAYSATDKVSQDLGTDGPLMAGERRMIGVLKAFAGRELTKVQMTTLAGLTPSSGTTSNYVRKLMRMRIIRFGQNGRFTLLNMDAPSIDVDLSRGGFKAMWDAQLMAGERRLLDLILEHGEMDKAALLEQAGLTNSGTTANYLRKLKRCGLIEVEGNIVRQSTETKELIG